MKPNQFVTGVAASMLLSGLLASPAIAADDPRYSPLHQQDLPGMNYRTVDNWVIDQCRRACALEVECRAWTFTPFIWGSAYGNPQGRCYLKSGRPRPRYDGVSTSALKPPPPAIKATRDQQPIKRPDSMGDPPPPVVKR